MSCVEQMAIRAEEMLRAGVHDHREILDACLEFVDVEDVEKLRREIGKKRLSLAISTIKDADGDRLAYPHKVDGRAVVLHLDYSRNAGAMLDLANRKRRRAAQEAHEAARLEERATQLSLFAAAAD